MRVCVCIEGGRGVNTHQRTLTYRSVGLSSDNTQEHATDKKWLAHPFPAAFVSVLPPSAARGREGGRQTQGAHARVCAYTRALMSLSECVCSFRLSVPPGQYFLRMYMRECVCVAPPETNPYTREGSAQHAAGGTSAVVCVSVSVCVCAPSAITWADVWEKETERKDTWLAGWVGGVELDVYVSAALTFTITQVPLDALGHGCASC